MGRSGSSVAVVSSSFHCCMGQKSPPKLRLTASILKQWKTRLKLNIYFSCLICLFAFLVFVPVIISFLFIYCFQIFIQVTLNVAYTNFTEHKYVACGTSFFIFYTDSSMKRCIIFSVVFKIFIYYLCLFSFKKAVGGGGRGVNLTSPLKGKREPCFFVTFNIILKYIFPENCRLLEDIKIYFVNINYFHQFFENFDISLMQINYDVSIFLTFSLL